MRPALRLFLVMGQAAAMVTATYFALILIAVWPIAAHASPGIQTTAGAVGVFAPICFAGWWIFRRLQAFYARREARAAAITFGLFTPVPLGIGLLLGPIVGGYTGIFLGTGSRLVAFSGALMGIVDRLDDLRSKFLGVVDYASHRRGSSGPIVIARDPGGLDDVVGSFSRVNMVPLATNGRRKGADPAVAG